MSTPFTKEQFFDLFERYNWGVFPAQLVLLFLAFGAVVLVHSKLGFRTKAIGSFLGLLWFWTGIVYHIAFFSQINPIAIFFGAAFIIQGVLLVLTTYRSDVFNFSFAASGKDYLAYFFILFGLILYPLIGLVEGHKLSQTIAIGLPCPSTIVTFGFLLLAARRLPRYLLIIPSLWSIIGLTAAISFGVYQDIVMLVAAISADVILMRRNHISIVAAK